MEGGVQARLQCRIVRATQGVWTAQEGPNMYVAAIHRISDPEKFFAVAQETLGTLPEGLRVDQMLPSVDGSAATCVWQAPSVDAVRELVDGASAGLATNEF